MNYHCAKFYTNTSTNTNTSKIFQFPAIFEQNFTVLPQNIRFWTYSAWHHSLYLSLMLWTTTVPNFMLLSKSERSSHFLTIIRWTTGRIWPKNNNTCKGPWVLHPYQVSSKSIKRFWRRSWKCKSLRTDDGRTDGRTDDGRCAMTIAHLSLWLRWAKKYKRLHEEPGR